MLGASMTQPRHGDTIDKSTFTINSTLQEQHNNQKMPSNLATRSAQCNFEIQQEKTTKTDYARLCASATLFSQTLAQMVMRFFIHVHD